MLLEKKGLRSSHAFLCRQLLWCTPSCFYDLPQQYCSHPSQAPAQQHKAQAKLIGMSGSQSKPYHSVAIWWGSTSKQKKGNWPAEILSRQGWIQPAYEAKCSNCGDQLKHGWAQDIPSQMSTAPAFDANSEDYVDCAILAILKEFVALDKQDILDQAAEVSI